MELPVRYGLLYVNAGSRGSGVWHPMDTPFLAGGGVAPSPLQSCLVLSEPFEVLKTGHSEA
jgi:hypothetical protein